MSVVHTESLKPYQIADQIAGVVHALPGGARGTEKKNYEQALIKKFSISSVEPNVSSDYVRLGH